MRSFKLFNFRFFPILFAFMAAGVIAAVFLYKEVVLDYIVLGISLLSSTLLIIFLKRKAFLYVAFIIGFSFCYLSAVACITERLNARIDSFTTDCLNVRIERVSQDKSVIFCKITDNSFGISGEGMLVLSGEQELDFLSEGAELLLGNAEVKPVSASVENGALNLFYFNSVRNYTVYSSEIIEFDVGSPTLSERMRNRLSIAAKDMPEEIKGVAFALITGDKYAVEGKLYDAYKLSGITHVLAVSGLHVGFIVFVFDKLLRRMKARKSVRIFVLVPLLLCFCALCDYAPSVIRASVMSIICLVVPSVSNRRYDSLSALCFSGVVLIALSPMTLFACGFLLSYSAAFGIMAFVHKFEKIFAFLPRFMRGTVAVSVAVSIVTFPLSAILFESVSVVSILTNILVLPILSACYGILFIAALLVSFFPFLSFLLTASGAFIYYVNYVALLLGNISVATAEFASPLWFVIPYYLFCLTLSDYIFLSVPVKRIIFLCLIFLFMVYASLTFCNSKSDYPIQIICRGLKS